MDYLYLILGLLVLIFGGDFLVKGAVGFSNKFKISPLIIGMTVVAFGTSAPELLVSIQSALGGKPGIAIGNVIGSNIANIALVLGITALIFPIIIDKHTKIVDYPMMILASVLFFILGMDGQFGLIDGIILFSILILFIVGLILHSRKNILDVDEGLDEVKDENLPVWKSSLILLAGCLGLYFGSEWFIEGAVGIANKLLEGNPNKHAIIGVTVVAFGTSAPELVASGVAAYKKQTDISVGNLIGSNIFNIFAVIGITSIIQPIKISQQVMKSDVLWMLGVAVLLGFILYFGKKIGRLKGTILFLTYIIYIGIILAKVKGLI